MQPVRERDHRRFYATALEHRRSLFDMVRLTVVNIVKWQIWVLWVVDHERAAKSVTVLRHVMAVVPERPCAQNSVQPSPALGTPARMPLTCLSDGSEVVQERAVGRKGALGDKCRPVRKSSRVLENAMPVLPGGEVASALSGI